MLVFSTKIPLRKDASQRECTELFMRWAIEYRQYPFTAADFEGYDSSGSEELEISRGCYTFSMTHYKDDAVELSACRVITKTDTEVWTTQNVAYAEDGRKFLGVQTYCTKLKFNDLLPAAYPPFTIRLFVRSGLCDTDGGIPVSNYPIAVSELNIQACGEAMKGCGENIMPLVYISKDYWEIPIDTTELAKALFGLAHVLVEPDVQTSYRIREASDGNNVYRGFIGIYFPGLAFHRKFSAGDYPNDAAGERMAGDIRETVVNALLNKVDATRYSWDQIRMLQHRQKLGSLSLDTAELSELREWYETFEQGSARLTDDLSDASADKAALYDEIQKLRAMLDGYKASGASAQPYILKTGTERDLYPGEQADLIIDILRKKLSTLREDSRPYHIIESLLAANQENGTGRKIESGIKKVFEDRGEIVSKSAQRELQDLGFTISKEGKHFKLVYAGDPRYNFSASVTPSDYRSGDNTVTKICGMLFARN